MAARPGAIDQSLLLASPTSSLAGALRQAAQRLTEAGVPSPRADAEILAAHLCSCSRGQLLAAAFRGQSAPCGYAEVVEQRCRRIPLQHITGQAPFRNLTIEVGPGVFIPRPETEQVAQAAIDAARQAHSSPARPDAVAGREQQPAGTIDQPIVVDLCTGSGAIAAAIAAEVSQARVFAVEKSPGAHAWAKRNLRHTGVMLVQGDALDALPGLNGRCDVVVANPPYVPDDEPPADPEVRDYDPPESLYGGGVAGLGIPSLVVASAARLLRPGGVLVMEHGENQAGAVRECVGAHRLFAHIVTHTDLVGRPRFVWARRTAVPVPGQGVHSARPGQSAMAGPISASPTRRATADRRDETAL